MTKKILLADDSPTIRKVVELTFADEGIEVHSVPDGDAAMVKFVQIEPDMVIADVNMPGMTGYRLCEMIKQDETTHHIPVILLVGSFEPFDPGEASRVGSNYYFTKPFRSIRELVDKVHECLEIGGSAPIDDSSDIDGLYNDSLANTADAEGPEDEAAVFGVHSETDEEPRLDETNHFDDGPTLDEILQETPSNGKPETQFLEVLPPETFSPLSGTEPGEDIDVDHSGQSLNDAADDSHSSGPLDTSEIDIHTTFDETESDFHSEDADLLDLELPAASETDAEQPDSGESESYRSEFGPDSDALGDTDVETGEEPDFFAVDDAAAAAASADESLVGPDLSSPWEQPVAEPESSILPELHNATELGDAGMDDEIIEAVHPNAGPETVATPAPEPIKQLEPAWQPIDPFHERVAGIGSFAGGEHSTETAPSEMPFPGSGGLGDPSAQTTPELATASSSSDVPSLGSHVTPELIESIVASVLEKMSDRAVRDAAQEAVPRIAEKLIREALVDDKKA
ncbi:MAG: response regulator [Acidobacteriota bacterium]